MQGIYCLQEFGAVVLMLPNMAFQLSGKVVTLHLDNSIAKANLILLINYYNTSNVNYVCFIEAKYFLTPTTVSFLSSWSFRYLVTKVSK